MTKEEIAQDEANYEDIEAKISTRAQDEYTDAETHTCSW